MHDIKLSLKYLSKKCEILQKKCKRYFSNGEYHFIKQLKDMDSKKEKEK